MIADDTLRLEGHINCIERHWSRIEEMSSWMTWPSVEPTRSQKMEHASEGDECDQTNLDFVQVVFCW